MPEPAGLLHGCLGLSTVTHGRIRKIDLTAVRAAPGVVDVLTAKDIPGENDISPTGRHDEPVLADGVVQFFGQPIFCVIARTREEARRATRFAKVEYEELPFILDVAELDPVKGKLVTPPLTLKRGDAKAAIRQAPKRIKGRMALGGQDHFYLEGQIALGRAGRGPGRHGLLLDPASERSPAHGVTCAWRSLECRDGRDPPHGRRLRRQGDAGQPVRRTGRDRRQEASPRRQDQARPRRRHDRDRQAARFRHRLRGRLRQRKATSTASTSCSRRAAAFPPTFRPGHRPRAVPLRQHLLLAGGACAVCAALHQHGVQYGVPRLRRTAGHGRRGARDRGGGLRRRQGPARDPQAQFLRYRRPQRHALPPDGRGQHHPPHRRRAGGKLRLRAPPPHDRGLQQQQPLS